MTRSNGKSTKQEPSDSDSPASTNTDEKVKVAFSGFDNRLYFALKRTAKLRRVAEIFADNAKVPVDSIRFNLDGRPIRLEDTPNSCGMVDSDCVDVTRKTDGGGLTLVGF